MTEATTSMAGKTVLITGATSGIGKEAAKALAKMGADLTLLARSKEKAQQTVAEINAVAPNAKVEVLLADLASLADVRRAAREFKASHPKLHVLINNAGGVFTSREVTKDGFEMTFGMNHLAHFVLTNELLDLLKASAPARIVNVSSEAHRMGKINFDDLMGEKSYAGMRAYGQAKLANILFTRELTRRLQGTGVVANALHPGVVATGFGRNTPGIFNFFVGLAAPFMLTPEQGAQTTVYLASSPEVEKTSGEYFMKRRPAKPRAQALNDETARRLWEVSEQLTSRA